MVQKPGLAPMRVCVFSPEDKVCEQLIHNSELAGYKVEGKFSEPRQLLEFISCSNIDHVVLIDLGSQPEHHLQLISDLGTTRPLAIVALANKTDPVVCARAMEVGAQSLLIDPIEAKDIFAAVTTAVHQRSRQLRLEDESRELHAKLADRKLIEKAKGILMESANVTEGEAFRLIRKQSQDKRKPMAEIATLIISAAELVRSARASAE